MIKFQRLPSGSGLPLASRATLGSAGLDLRASHAVFIPMRDRALVGTGFSVEIPEGHVGHIRPRSGLALKEGLVAFGGTIDSDYRGELKVLLFNWSQNCLQIEHGDRIAQIVIAPVSMFDAIEIEPEFSTETSRGNGGFGSTGTA